MYLHIDDVKTVLQFMEAFPSATRVELISDNSSGIGDFVEAKLHGVDLNGMVVTVSKVIVDESTW